MRVYSFWAIAFVIIKFNSDDIFVSSQTCQSQNCIMFSEDIAHRMWSMAGLRNNVFRVYSDQLARSRHYQLALWHMSMASQVGSESASGLSNETSFQEPDISVAYRNEIERVVDGFAKGQHDHSIHDLGLDEEASVMDQLWSLVCSQDVAITQRLIAAILLRQRMVQEDEDVLNQVEKLTTDLYNNAIPEERWNTIVKLTGRSLCDSDICPWLHRVIEQVEHYFTDISDDKDHPVRVAMLVRQYCMDQRYAIMDDLIGHKDPHTGVTSHINFPFPNPTAEVNENLIMSPGTMFETFPETHPLYDVITTLIKTVNEVPSEDIKANFDLDQDTLKRNAQDTQKITQGDLFNYLITHEKVKNKMNQNKQLKDIVHVYELLINAVSGNNNDIKMSVEDMAHLVKYFPIADGPDELKNLEQLKQLLSDPKELQSFLSSVELSDVNSERELLEEIIRNLLIDMNATKYEFTYSLHDILKKIVEEGKDKPATKERKRDEEISPLDTVIIEVDPSRLDRKPRFAQPGGYYSEEVDRPRSKYTLQYTVPSPVLETTIHDVTHLEDLIPPLQKIKEDSMGYEFINSCKKLVSDPDVRDKIFGTEFDLKEYPTKIMLLEHVFERLENLTASNEIEADHVLKDFIKLYQDILEFANDELGVAPITMLRTNFAELVTLLPKPNGKDELEKYEVLYSFLLDDDHLDYVVKDMDPHDYSTRADILEYILSRCTDFVEDADTRTACSYYLPKISYDDARSEAKPEKYVVYKKANLERLNAKYVQLNPLRIKDSEVTPKPRPARKGFMQIPIADPTLEVNAKDQRKPSRMIPDVDSSSDMYYNITNLKWQLRREDALSDIFEEELDWDAKNKKVEALEEVLDRLIALALSEELYMQPHSLQFATMYDLALKVAAGKIVDADFLQFDFIKLIDAIINYTDDEELIKHCKLLHNLFNDRQHLMEILGDNTHLNMYKNDVTILRVILKKIIQHRDEKLGPARVASRAVLDFLKLLGIGYNFELVTTVEHKELDIADAFDAAIDRDKVPKELYPAYKTVSKFLMEDMVVSHHLPDFDFEAASTKADLIENMLHEFLSTDTVDDRVKEAIEIMLPQIDYKGRGAEPLK